MALPDPASLILVATYREGTDLPCRSTILPKLYQTTSEGDDRLGSWYTERDEEQVSWYISGGSHLHLHRPD